MNDLYTQENPRPLKTEFVRDGMTHRQMKREGNIAIFELGREPWAGYEVVIIRVAKPQKLPTGEMAPWRESYPSTGEFGSKGWYLTSKVDAERRFAWLVAKHHGTS